MPHPPPSLFSPPLLFEAKLLKRVHLHAPPTHGFGWFLLQCLFYYYHVIFSYCVNDCIRVVLDYKNYVRYVILHYIHTYGGA